MGALVVSCTARLSQCEAASEAARRQEVLKVVQLKWKWT